MSNHIWRKYYYPQNGGGGGGGTPEYLHYVTDTVFSMVTHNFFSAGSGTYAVIDLAGVSMLKVDFSEYLMPAVPAVVYFTGPPANATFLSAEQMPDTSSGRHILENHICTIPAAATHAIIQGYTFTSLPTVTIDDGSPVYTATQFVARAKLAYSCPSCYVSGGWGQPLNAANKVRMINKNSFNYTYRNIINAQASNCIAWDCICLLKGLLWGWCNDLNDPNGGAVYGSNNVPDIGENTMIQRCTGVSTNFSNIVPGEMLWMDGHAGIYIGNGLGIECTTGFGEWGVIKSAVGNIGPISGYHTRYWTKHGKLPYISYP